MNLTLSQFQSLIKRTIETNIRTQWVLCDISNLKVNGNGHCYLELTEKSEGKGAIPKAKATAIIWKNNFHILRSYFAKETGIELSAGIKVLLLVEANYHELYGLSLIVKDIDPAYSLGDAERLKRETIARLTAEGIIDMNRDIELPAVVEKLAVISSATAAGYDDFVNHLKNNPYGYGFSLDLYEAVVQGEGAEGSIISALMDIHNSGISYDATVIIRGGGSQSDLSCFNNYNLCFYLAQFPFPILTGIGHNKDNSVADRVAHTTLKTPTAVANFLIDTKRAFDERLDMMLNQLLSSLDLFVESQERRIENFQSQLQILTMNFVNRERIKIERGENNLGFSVQTIFTKEGHKLSLFENQINNSDPQHILDMGYSYVVSNGKIVRDVNQIKKGDTIETTLKNGKVKSIVI